MAAKRTLNIPTYDHQEAPADSTLGDEDVLDAEVLDDDVTFGDRLRSGFAAASSARQARSQAPRAQQKERLRRERSDARQAAADRAQAQREGRTDPLVKLRLDTARAGEQYMDSLRRSGILDADQTPEKQREQLTGMHQIYARMMVLQCVGPLQQGLTSQNVVSTLGMAASMWMLSPTFRTQIGHFGDSIRETINNKIDERGEKKDNKARSRFEKLAAKGKADKLAGKWQRRLDRIEHEERGHRLPFTAQSAAMTEVALAEAAYADMRRPGADAVTINDRYQTALASLYGYVENDGLEHEEVSKAMRVIVGQRLEKEPHLSSVFSELGHGRFVKSAPREVYINGGVESQIVWTGDFVDMYEARTINSGSFRVRPVMSTTEHRALASETIAAEMVQASTPEELNDILSQYVVATSVGRHPDVIDTIEDPAALRRFGKARTMFSSMQDDGLSAEDQQFAYGAAYMDAIEVLQVARPDLGAAWLAQYGENWREKVAENLARFNEMGGAAERAKARGAAGPDEPEKERKRSSGRTPKRPAPEPAFAGREEDIVDAEVVDDEGAFLAADQGAARAAADRETPVRRPAPGNTPRTLEDIAFPVDSLEDEPSELEVIDGEIVDDIELEAAAARRSILAGTKSQAIETSTKTVSPAAKIKRARVNQGYNEVETGGITGIGSDDAQPLQDPDFQLG